MTEKLISIVVPIYKVENYLNKCVESIVNQTYKNLEILLVDDGSPDNCPQMCDDWAKKDSRIKVIHKPNGGLSDARNVGIDAASGEYIMFVDSDDYVDLSICSKLYTILIENNADFSMCDAARFIESETPENKIDTPVVKLYRNKEVLNQLFYADSDYLVVAWGKLYKMEIFKDVRYPKGRLHEDVYTLHHVLGQTKTFAYTNDQLYFYLQRESSIMSKFTERNYRDTFDAYLERYEYFKNNQNLFSEEENILHLMGNLRSLYCRSSADKFDIKNEILEKYKKAYSQIKKKPLKDIIFRRFNWLYRILFKLKGN